MKRIIYRFILFNSQALFRGENYVMNDMDKETELES